MEHVRNTFVVLCGDVSVHKPVFEGIRVSVIVGKNAAVNVTLVGNQEQCKLGTALAIDCLDPLFRDVKRILVRAVINDESPICASQRVRKRHGRCLAIRSGTQRLYE